MIGGMKISERKIESCNGNIIHEDIVVRVKSMIPTGRNII